MPEHAINQDMGWLGTLRKEIGAFQLGNCKKGSKHMCKHSTKFGVNPLIPALADRPRCSELMCDNPKAIISCLKDGSPNYRKVCQHHHQAIITKRYGVKNTTQVSAMKAGFATVTDYLDWHAQKAGFQNHASRLDQQAKQQGYTNLTEKKNSTHRYLKYRGDHCENTDGRLGFVCTSTIHWIGMLDVDHKNGNHLDDDPSNLQTLCKCCHAYKTNIDKDYLTPGRKTRRAA